MIDERPFGFAGYIKVNARIGLIDGIGKTLRSVRFIWELIS
jgi:hypothetical protein